MNSENHPTPNRFCDNPYIGMVFEPLAQALNLLWPLVLEGKWVEFTAIRRISRFSVHDSPFIMLSKSWDDQIVIEIAGNLFCDPPVDASGHAVMLQLGFTGPSVDASEFLDENGFGGVPNYQLKIASSSKLAQVTEKMVEALIRVYGITRLDRFRFSGSIDFYDVNCFANTLEWSNESFWKCTVFMLPRKPVSRELD